MIIQLLQTGLDPFWIAWIQFCLYFAPIALVAIPVLVVAWAIWEFYVTPIESREIRTAKMKHRSLNLLAGDDGFLDLKRTERAGAEGATETKGEGRNKEHWTGFHSRYHPLNGMPEVNEGFDQEKTGQAIDYISRLTTHHSFLRGAKVPLSVGYKGKAILTSILSLAGLDFVATMQLYKDKPEEALKKVGEIIGNGTKIDITVLKSLFDSSWNESQIIAQEEDKRRIGFAEAKRKMGDRMPLLWLIAVIGLVLGIGVLLVVLVWLMGGK